MESVAAEVAAKGPDEGKVLATLRLQEDAVAVSPGNDSVGTRRRTFYRGTPALNLTCPVHHFADYPHSC